MIDQIRNKARELLESKAVDCVIGYERASDGVTARPAFVYNASQVDRLLFDNSCAHNLSKYLLNRKDKKTAVVAKPCDTRSINLLINENQITREAVYIIGIACSGINNSSFGQTGTTLQSKCKTCTQHKPVVFDFLVGEAPAETTTPDYADVAKMENMSPAERQEFWTNQFNRCIRCYGCRQTCAGCYCQECFVEELDPLWAGIRVAPGENFMFHFGRAFHLSARCIGCGECERACPVNIPLMLLNRKLEKDTSRLFDFIPGMDAQTKPSFATFKKDEDLGTN